MNTAPSGFNRLALPLATWFGAGYAPAASGTVGTIAALPLLVPVWWYGPVWAQAAVALAIAAAGIWAGDVAARGLGIKDPGCVVIDEAAGMMTTLIAVPPGWIALLGGFVLFRAMDVLKPPPARQCERFPGGWGIMLDDLVAGLYANLALRAGLHLLEMIR